MGWDPKQPTSDPVSTKKPAVVKSSDDSTADPMFLVKLYYHQQQPPLTTVHFVVVPQVDRAMVSVVSAWCATVCYENFVMTSAEIAGEVL